MAKKKTTEKALNIDNILFNCRDYLRAARNSGSFFEKRDMMLTLVFLRFIGEKYEDGIENLKQTLKEQGLDPEDENIRAAFFDDATFADGTYNLPPEARWSTIISTPAPQLNVALDTALQRLEEEDPQLKGCFVKGTFTARNLAANDIKKIVDEVNKISHKTFGEEKDLIGRVYEYFLKEFAVNATKEEGEFYTPHDVVQLIATMIEPYDGTLYDPCCGSGGMFIQSAELVKSKQGNLNGINVYGQEKEPATYRLAKMNLALRGISHNLGEEADSSFTHDLHKGLHFNYIMANPPFNLKGWYNDNLKNDGRWSDYQTPPESNANYAWILHILSHLKKGRILSIDKKTNEIVFQVLVDKVIDKRDALFSGIKLIDCECEGKSIVKFGVKKRIERDSDADYSEEIVPFQIAYAVSIHKAQGLEYESVKVVITEDVDERISHNIFYTAITRTTDRLKIYMSKETQNKLAEKFVKSNVGLQQAQLFAGHAGLKLKNKLSS